MRVLIGVWALLLCACGEREVQQGPVASPSAAAIVETASPRTPAEPPLSAPKRPAPAGLGLPGRFTALGTEPFWAAKVDEAKLTYSTPEDQAGRAITVTRTSNGKIVELEGSLNGMLLTLKVSASPCSDGMSDTVYPFSVRRRLGDDEQRGCAKPG